jgi:hypothetical protein
MLNQIVELPGFPLRLLFTSLFLYQQLLPIFTSSKLFNFFLKIDD